MFERPETIRLKNEKKKKTIVPITYIQKNLNFQFSHVLLRKYYYSHFTTIRYPYHK